MEYDPQRRRMVKLPHFMDWRAPEHSQRTNQGRDERWVLILDPRPAILMVASVAVGPAIAPPTKAA